jgi:predicted GH43/DUF377 family glycosyl hydrolase
MLCAFVDSPQCQCEDSRFFVAVFTCGSVLLGRELWVYYGSADTVIGLAKGNIDDFLREL